MFAIEIDYLDGISSPETVLVRRQQFIIGSSDFAHLIVEGLSSEVKDYRIVRGLGRDFTCEVVTQSGRESSKNQYSSFLELDLGGARAKVTALDQDLIVKVDESLDVAAKRILQSALGSEPPKFPAVVVVNSGPTVFSFDPGMTIIVGRSREVDLRLDSSEVSSEHAMIGFEDNKFWIQDLGSTNGTFIGDRRVQEKEWISEKDSVVIGVDFLLRFASSDESLKSCFDKKEEELIQESNLVNYPCLVADHELVKPSRYVLGSAERITIGRDPTNDIWVAASHISRTHLELEKIDQGIFSLLDSSSNGAKLNGLDLVKEQKTEIPKGLSIVDLMGGVTLGICYNQEQENSYFKQNEAKLEEKSDTFQVAEHNIGITGDSSFESLNDSFALDQEDSFLEQDSFEVSSFKKLAERAGKIEATYQPRASEDRVELLSRNETSSQFAQKRYRDELEPPVMGRVGKAIVTLVAVVVVITILWMFVYVFGPSAA